MFPFYLSIPSCTFHPKPLCRVGQQLTMCSSDLDSRSIDKHPKPPLITTNATYTHDTEVNSHIDTAHESNERISYLFIFCFSHLTFHMYYCSCLFHISSHLASRSRVPAAMANSPASPAMPLRLASCFLHFVCISSSLEWRGAERTAKRLSSVLRFNIRSSKQCYHGRFCVPFIYRQP